MVVAKKSIFRGDARKWMRCPKHEKSWANFKTTLIDGHQELRDTDANVDKLDFHSANTIVSQIIDQLPSEIPAENDRMVHLSDQAPISPPPTHINLPVVTHVNPPVVAIEIANSIQQTDLSMATLITIMITNMEATRLKIEGNETRYARCRKGRGRGRGRSRGRGRGIGKLGRGCGGRTVDHHHTTGKYCHTHGNCPHASSECETPMEQHKCDATFTNMMNSNTDNCSRDGSKNGKI